MAEKPDRNTRLNNFYRMQYAWLLRALNVLLIIMAILFVVILYFDYNKPSPRYYQSATDGSISRIYALTRPMVGTQALRDWATLAAVSAYTYNFTDYEQRFKATSEYFTPDAWRAFILDVQASELVDKLTTQKLIVSAVAKGATVVVDQRLINDRWTWKVQVPLLVSYRGGVQPVQNSLVVTMLITRVPSREIPKGIAIKQFFSKPAGGGTALSQ